MALTITDQVIRSPDTPHIARRATELDRQQAIAAAWHARQPGRSDLEAATIPDDGWRVSWLHDRVLSPDQAITAMTIAEEVGRIPADCDPEVYDSAFWARVGALADELGLSGPDAVVRASEAPAGT